MVRAEPRQPPSSCVLLHICFGREGRNSEWRGQQPQGLSTRSAAAAILNFNKVAASSETDSGTVLSATPPACLRSLLCLCFHTVFSDVIAWSNRNSMAVRVLSRRNAAKLSANSRKFELFRAISRREAACCGVAPFGMHRPADRWACDNL